MLQAHSLLWHYLWIAPNVLLLILAFWLFRARFDRKNLLFLVFAIVTAIEQLTVYAADVIPSVDAATFWKVFWIGILIEGPLKLAVVGGIFAHAFSSYASIAKLGGNLIRGVGIALVLAAAIAAGFAPPDSLFGIVSGAHLLQQTIYLIECGLLLFIFLFSSYFSIRLNRQVFGIALGLAVSGSVHLATWAVAANSGLPQERRFVLDFVNMATYHICVLIWFYYLLIPEKTKTHTGGDDSSSASGVPQTGTGSKEDLHNLEVWNQELERLLHQ